MLLGAPAVIEHPKSSLSSYNDRRFNFRGKSCIVHFPTLSFIFTVVAAGS
jgi:hypothetical protein